MISKLSPVEVPLFQRKNGSRTENAYYLESGLLRAEESFFGFFILKIPDPCRNPDFTKFLPVMHFHTIQEHPVQI